MATTRAWPTFALALAGAAACGGRAVDDATASGFAASSIDATTDVTGAYDANPTPSPDAGVALDGGAAADAGNGAAADAGICPAGMVLCDLCGWTAGCYDVCPPPPPCQAPYVPQTNLCSPDAATECACPALHCGDDCMSACAPRPASSGWCSKLSGPVWADEAAAASATACDGLCVQMLDLDDAMPGVIPIVYGCQTMGDGGPP